MALNFGFLQRCVNLWNIFGVFHLAEMIVSIATIVSIASASHTGPPNEFGFILFVGVLAAIYSTIWCSTLVLNIWPPGTPLMQYVHLVGGLIMSQFYLTAFAVCCVTANTVSLCSGLCVAGVCGFKTHHVPSFAVAAFFTAAGWVLHSVETFISWWWYGGIHSPSQRQFQLSLTVANGAGNGKNSPDLNNKNASKALPVSPAERTGTGTDTTDMKVEIMETEIVQLRSSKRRETELWTEIWSVAFFVP